jgi:nucleoside-diphosphate-sugar epimerase
MKSAFRDPHAAILVAGAAGFAGRHLIEPLAAAGSDVIAWHRPGYDGRTDRWTSSPVGSDAGRSSANARALS